MKRYRAAVFALVRKELLLESRALENLSTLFVLAFLGAASLGLPLLQSGFDPEQRVRLFPACFWALGTLVLIFASSRSFAHEVHARAAALYFLSRVPLGLVFSVKFAVLFLIQLGGAILVWFLLGTMLLPSIFHGFIDALPIVVLGCGQLAAITVLLAPIAAYSRLGALLLPLLALPLLLPMVLIGAEYTLLCFEVGTPESPLLVAAGVFFCVSFLCGLFLYRHVLRSP